MLLTPVFVILVTALFVQAFKQDYRDVKTAQGPVRGYKETDSDAYAFYGIPYATAPTGNNKFKAPLPPPVWLEKFEAVEKDITCPQAQMPMFQFNSTIREDCLIANVFVPDTAEKNLPVVVYIHGGAYQLGFGNMLPVNGLLQSKKIIAVNFNYRLGIHGFLCLGTDDAPGNAGMKDQVALLRWVKKNIAAFGGNPNHITIDGYSAGSSAVDLLILSKTTHGLFQKAIPESGSNLATWSVQIDPVANAKEFATKLGFENVDDIYALENFFKTSPLHSLMKDPFLDRTDSTFVFSPCVERDTGVEMFLDEAPINILKKGKYMKLPMLYGFSNMEGLFRYQNLFPSWAEKMNSNFAQFLPADLQFDNEAKRNEVANKIKEFYFGTEPVSDKNALKYIDYFSDVIFAYSTLRSVKLQVEAGNDRIYLYEYSFPDKEGNPDHDTILGMGANHCSQSSIVADGFPHYHDFNKATDKYRTMKKIMRDIWLNFMTTGKPVAESGLPDWPAVGAGNAPYMRLDLPPKLEGSLLEERTKFWDDIYEKHYRVPMPPSTPSTSSRVEL